MTYYKKNNWVLYKVNNGYPFVHLKLYSAPFFIGE